VQIKSETPENSSEHPNLYLRHSQLHLLFPNFYDTQKHSILLGVNNLGWGVELNANIWSFVASVVLLLRGLK
jgi:hypothetical protein